MFASRSSGDDFASIAGVDYSSAVSKDTNSRTSPVLDDLFSDDDDDKVETTPAVETTTIENPLTTSSGVEMPQVSSSKPAPSSLGIEIPDFDTDSTSVAPDDDTAKSELPSSLMIQATCTSCDTRFEVELPAGRTSGRTACPSCGEIQTVSR